MFPATPCQQEEDTKRHARKARGARAVDVIRSHGNRRAAHRRERLPTILRHIVFQRLAVRVPAEGIDREIIHKDRGGWENGGRPWRRRKLPLLPEVDERGHLATPRAPSGNIVGGGASASPAPLARKTPVPLPRRHLRMQLRQQAHGMPATSPTRLARKRAVPSPGGVLWPKLRNPYASH